MSSLRDYTALFEKLGFSENRARRMLQLVFDGCKLPTMSAFDAIGEFEHMVLLAVLRLDDDAYAVTVREEILERTGRDVTRGSIYITLDRLETKGYLKSRLGDPTPERGGRAKRYYTLRPVAIEALKESRRALVNLWRGIEAKLA
jgi:PadR family transcriptional regulator, regulatory protein PadR